MTPDEHAAEAERVYGTSDWLDQPRDADSLAVAVGALVHAVLSTRQQLVELAVAGTECTAPALPEVYHDASGDLWIFGASRSWMWDNHGGWGWQRSSAARAEVEQRYGPLVAVEWPVTS